MLFLRNILDRKDLCLNIKEAIISLSSFKKVVLAFDSGLGGYQSSKIIGIIKELKKDNDLKEALKHLEIITFDADNPDEELSGYNSDEYLVFGFSRSAKRDNVSGYEKDFKLSYIEENNFPDKAYYPLPEIVMITLAYYFKPGVKDSIQPLLAMFNIKSFSELNAETKTLLFKLIPDAEAMETQSLIKEYASLKRFLNSV